MSRSRTLTLEQYPCGPLPQGTILQREGSFVRFALGGKPHHQRKISMPASVRRLSLERTLSAPELSDIVASDSLIRHDSYTVQVDASRQSALREHRFTILILSLLKLILWLAYLLLRWKSLRFDTRQFWTGSIIYFMEIFLSIRDILLTTNLLLPLVSTARPLQRASYRLLGSRAPTVDICVTCCGEPVEIILNTVNAAIAQDYPTHSMRIMVLDDGRDDELRAQIDSLSRQSMLRNGPRLLYRSRQSDGGEASHYKSGNLQYGLEELRKLGPSEFFANLDCDMIPKKSWLRAMLPHLILDNQLSLVNPPQVLLPIRELHALEILLTMYYRIITTSPPTIHWDSRLILRRSFRSTNHSTIASALRAVWAQASLSGVKLSKALEAGLLSTLVRTLCSHHVFATPAGRLRMSRKTCNTDLHPTRSARTSSRSNDG